MFQVFSKKQKELALTVPQTELVERYKQIEFKLKCLMFSDISKKVFNEYLQEHKNLQNALLFQKTKSFSNLLRKIKRKTIK